jgi:hypothetical protein
MRRIHRERFGSADDLLEPLQRPLGPLYVPARIIACPTPPLTRRPGCLRISDDHRRRVGAPETTTWKLRGWRWKRVSGPLTSGHARIPAERIAVGEAEGWNYGAPREPAAIYSKRHWQDPRRIRRPLVLCMRPAATTASPTPLSPRRTSGFRSSALPLRLASTKTIRSRKISPRSSRRSVCSRSGVPGC